MHTEVIVLFFIVGSLAAIILVHLMNTHKTRIKTHELLEKSIEKGFDVTPELLDKLNNVKSPRFKDFHRGIIRCSIGAAGNLVKFNDTDQWLAAIQHWVVCGLAMD